MEGLLLYKLIILFMLDRTNYTMTNSIISDFVIGKGYTNLFNLHESLSELIDKDFISTYTIRDTIHYKITNLGEEALSFFENRLPYAIKQDILEYLKAEKINIKNESEIYADYFFNDSNWYTVQCVIKDRKETLVDIKFDVPTKSQAETICNNWRTKSSDIYSYLVNQLWTAE
ncbi:MAG: DUF4364 family protein [Lachnospiraceae bacterium]|nr:DUF4364 family protein [Lachnospiraceae bacterium]